MNCSISELPEDPGSLLLTPTSCSDPPRNLDFRAHMHYSGEYSQQKLSRISIAGVNPKDKQQLCIHLRGAFHISVPFRSRIPGPNLLP